MWCLPGLTYEFHLAPLATNSKIPWRNGGLFVIFNRSSFRTKIWANVFLLEGTVPRTRKKERVFSCIWEQATDKMSWWISLEVKACQCLSRSPQGLEVRIISGLRPKTVSFVWKLLFFQTIIWQKISVIEIQNSNMQCVTQKRKYLCILSERTTIGTHGRKVAKHIGSEAPESIYVWII